MARRGLLVVELLAADELDLDLYVQEQELTRSLSLASVMGADEVAPEETPRELRAKLETIVEVIGERLAAEEPRLPYKRIATVESVEDGTISWESIPIPGELHWTFESGALEERLRDLRALIPPRHVLPQDPEQLREKVKDLCKLVFNYAGSFQFEDEDFQAALTEFESEHHLKRAEFDVYVPLDGLRGLTKGIEMDSTVPRSTHEDAAVRVDKIHLGPLEPEELSGLLTYSDRSGTGPGRATSLRWTHRLRLQGRADVKGAPVWEIAEQVLRALRLYKEGAPPIGAKYWFRHAPGWLEHRTGIMQIQGVSASSLRRAGHAGEFELTGEDVAPFRVLWTRLGPLLVGDPPDDLAVGIRHFEQSYEKARSEDQLLDCAVALESTVLRDMPPTTESISFRLRMRGAVLLSAFEDLGREHARDLLKEVYKKRSKTVHSGEELDSIEVGDREYAPSAFAAAARDLVRRCLLVYLLSREEGHDVEATNRWIDEAFLQADGPVDPSALADIQAPR